jgi:hypothetical protein
MSRIGFKESFDTMIVTGHDVKRAGAKVIERERSLLTRCSAVFSLKLLSRFVSHR